MSCYCNNCDARTEDVSVSEWLYSMAWFGEPPTVDCSICGRGLESQHNVYKILLDIVEKSEG